jgi:hypothetical protein
VAHETRLRELQLKRDQAQKDLDSYVAQYNRERAEALARPPQPPAYQQPQAPTYQQPQGPAYQQPQAPAYQQPQAPAYRQPPALQGAPTYPQPQSYQPPQMRRPIRKHPARKRLTSIGVAFGGRALDYEIAGISALSNFGVHLSHRMADTSLVFDLGFAHAGFVEPEGPSDRSFSSLEGSVGLRYMGKPEEASPRSGGAAWYVGAGLMGLEVVDQYVDPWSGVVLSEETASASGSYACAGLHFEGRSFGCGDLEIRKINDTDYSTYGVGKSSDGLEVLIRLSLAF